MTTLTLALHVPNCHDTPLSIPGIPDEPVPSLRSSRLRRQLWGGRHPYPGAFKPRLSKRDLQQKRELPNQNHQPPTLNTYTPLKHHYATTSPVLAYQLTHHLLTYIHIPQAHSPLAHHNPLSQPPITYRHPTIRRANTSPTQPIYRRPLQRGQNHTAKHLTTPPTSDPSLALHASQATTRQTPTSNPIRTFATYTALRAAILSHHATSGDIQPNPGPMDFNQLYTPPRTPPTCDMISPTTPEQAQSMLLSVTRQGAPLLPLITHLQQHSTPPANVGQAIYQALQTLLPVDKRFTLDATTHKSFNIYSLTLP